MRPVLFAGATAATIFGVRATGAASKRMSVSPIRLTPPGLTLPLVDLRRGTRPCEAAKSRALTKMSRSGPDAATAPAPTGPRRVMLVRSERVIPRRGRD